MASIRESGNHICTGCFVSHKHILTAAQCIIKILGYNTPDLSNFDIISNTRNYKILKLHANKKYDVNDQLSTSMYDYGMIMVSLLRPCGKVFHYQLYTEKKIYPTKLFVLS